MVGSVYFARPRGRDLRVGFTLIELLVVVLIIGILAAVALPQYQLAVYKTRFVHSRPWMDALARAQDVYYMSNGRYADDLAELDVSVPAGCVYSKDSLQSGTQKDYIECPDVHVEVHLSYHALQGWIKHCPLDEYCAVYTVPYKQANYIMGTAPSCQPSPIADDKARAFGERVCQSLGGRKNGDRYYL